MNLKTVITITANVSFAPNAILFRFFMMLAFGTLFMYKIQLSIIVLPFITILTKVIAIVIPK